jgi:hypothetical protein
MGGNWNILASTFQHTEDIAGSFITPTLVSTSPGYIIEIKGKHYRVHRIVAQEFIPNPQPEVLIFVNHKNGPYR